MTTRLPLLVLAGAAGIVFAAGSASAQTYSPASMTFFVTSVGSGNGGNLGGLAGADAHCQALATAAGAGNRTWVAYLSALADGATPAVNARDRIGTGPWTNANGVVVAETLDQLHAGPNNINKQTALTELGGVVNGRGDTPNQHDIMTGSLQDGTVAVDVGTCGNWTVADDTARTIVGHTDLIGNSQGINFWNYSHGTRGCSQQSLIQTGGNGYFYCFATD